MPNEEQTGAQAATSGAQGQEPNAASTTDTTTQQANAQQSANTTQAASSTDAQSQQQNAADSDLAKRLERMEKELADTRKEAANYRTKAKELDKLKEEADNAKLSEIEKATKAREKAEQALASGRSRIARAELKVAAKDAGIIDPDDAVAHLSGKIEFDSDGEPTNVGELVKSLKESKPHLFGAKSDAAAAKQQQTAAAGQAMGATNAQRAGGPLTVTANQYLDKAFQKSFRDTHGMDLLAALKAGKAQLV